MSHCLVMRKVIYESSVDEGRALFANAPSVHLATTGEDGHPILRVLHTISVRHDGHDFIAFHGAPAGEKMEGLNRRAVMSVHDVVAEIPSWFLDPERACPATTYYVSAQADGVIEEIKDLETKARILQALMTKYQPEGGHVPIRGDDPLYTKAVRGLLVAGLRVENIACKAKLGQNRRPEERRRVIENLWRRGLVTHEGHAGPSDVRAIDTLIRRFPDLAPSFLHHDGGVRFDVLAREEDLDEILALLEDAYWLTKVPRAKRREAIVASQAVIVARGTGSGSGGSARANENERDEHTNHVVGFARALSDGRVAWIYDVIVRDQRNGIGTAMMRLLLDHPAVRNVLAVRLTTRDAMPFYRRFGFRDLDEAPRHPWRSTEMICVYATADET